MKKTFKRLTLLIVIILFLLLLFLNMRYKIMFDNVSAQLNQTLTKYEQLEKDYKSLEKEVFKIETEKSNLSMQIDQLKDNQTKIATDIKKEQIQKVIVDEPKSEVAQVKPNIDYGKKVIGWGIAGLTLLKSVVPYLVPAL